MKSVELFAGAGGLALGLDSAGFQHLAVVERDAESCATIRANQGIGNGARDWPLYEVDVREFDYSQIRSEVDLLAGGVPCQPFSIGGKHLGYRDERNMFPEMIRAVRDLQPKAVLVENVRGLRRPAFLRYFCYIELSLTYPELVPKENEPWVEHLGRLERYHTRAKPTGLHYRVVHETLNAANFGIPQRRERVFLVAIRSDLGVEFSFPAQTHSRESLLWQQFGSGEYWDKHRIPKRHRPSANEQATRIVQQFSDSLIFDSELPWLTVRDALTDLGPPTKTRQPEEPGLTHYHIPGARSYPGHTGSPWDEPAKTLKAGDHGVPGGENTLLEGEGSVRYFTLRESARLQTFPDGYVFPGSWTESMRQIGNAVPVELARIIGLKLRTTLELQKVA